MYPLALLGPQRLQPTVGAVVADFAIDGPIAVVTAGWQEREEETDELAAALGRPIRNLQLYARWERLRLEHRELAAAHRQRQDNLRRQQELYRKRLAATNGVARALLAEDGPAELLDPERDSAILSLRALDSHHLRRVGALNRAWAADWDQLAELLDGCAAVAIAGGHVAVLLNRLQLFELAEPFKKLPIIAWSGGAMALSDRVVLFHDAPPQGEGDPEILDHGLGLAPGLVILPHARHRLRLDERKRVALLARRFAPALCVPFDEGDRVDLVDRRWDPQPGMRRLDSTGAVDFLEPPDDGETVTL
jgi:hypothetical protein